MDCASGWDGLFYYIVDGVRFAYKDARYEMEPSISASRGSIVIPLEAGQTVGIENIHCSSIYGNYHGRQRSFFSGEVVHAH